MKKNALWLVLAATSLSGLGCDEGETTIIEIRTDGGTGEGGDGAGGSNEGGGGANAGGGGAGGGSSMLADGSHCTTNDECASGFCLGELETGWPQGYCTGACNTLISCDEGSECLFAGADPFCFKTCDPAAPACESAQICLDIDETLSVCAAGCTLTADCPTLGKCDILSGYCVEPEDCADVVDNDGDGLLDCEDSECAEECATNVDATCAAASAASTTNAGDTTTGTAYFAGSCTGALGALEAVYTFSPASAGYLRVTLASATDQGLYVRTACSDAGSELACVDDQFAGGTEVLLTPVTAATPVAIFVDGYDSPAEAGPFTLGVSVLVPTNETEPNGTVAEANGVVAGLVDAAINPVDDMDHFAVTVPGPASTITVRTTDGGPDVCGPTGAIDTVVDILDVDGVTVLASNDDLSFGNYCSFASTSGLPAGTYTVRVAASTLCPGCTFSYLVDIDAQ